MQPTGAKPERVLPLVEHVGGLTREAIQHTSRETGVPEADVWGVATFYSLLEDVGHRVCQGLTCKLHGADQLLADLRAQGERAVPVSCTGQCDRAPAALDPQLEVIAKGNGGAVLPDDPDLPMNLGGADVADYVALARARELGAEGVLEAIQASKLQGRGGAGFPAGFKWNAVRGQDETERYVVCNADEAEPGTFKDREVMLRRPHLLLEGLAIAALVVEAQEIIVYIRGEFGEARRSLEGALAEVCDTHLDGFEVRFVSGHGAYICGEETALLESLEGKRGMPRLKPPFPTEVGYRGKPTLINNVETLACVPSIVLRGGEWFRALGKTEPGTKLYCISGHVVQAGVYELPLGATLDELVEAAGGYVGTPMAFSPGGASSGFLPISARSVPLDFESLKAEESMLGSAGVVVLNESVDMAAAAHWQLVFFEDESCGQCAPCRIGTRILRRALERHVEGEADALRAVTDVAWEMEEGSICGLGMTAFLPLTTAMKHFPQAFAKAKERG
jgi:NADH:ubiquinone oxidoreductase subunit F (NADH-binding)